MTLTSILILPLLLTNDHALRKPSKLFAHVHHDTKYDL